MNQNNFVNNDTSPKSAGKDIASIIFFIVFSILLLLLVTRKLILGNFGLMMSNLSLGIFGFFSYALYSAIVIGSVISLFSSKKKNNGLVVFSIFLIVIAGLFALQTWTANASVIINDKVNFNDFVNQSYKLKCSGLHGSSAGGALISALIYFPIKYLKLIGIYTLAGILFTGGVFGIISGIRKQYVRQINNHQINNNQNQVFDPRPESINAVKMGLNNDIKSYNIAQNYNSSIFDKNNGQVQQDNIKPSVEFSEPQQSFNQVHNKMPESLFGNNDLTQEQTKKQSHGLFGTKKSNIEKSNKLFIYNGDDKNRNIGQKSKRELNEERKNAKNPLFDDDIDSFQSNFVVNNYNKPRDLSKERKQQDVEKDIMSGNFNGLFDNNIPDEREGHTIPRYNDADSHVDFVNPSLSFEPKEIEVEKPNSTNLNKSSSLKKKKKREVDLNDLYIKTKPKKKVKIVSELDDLDEKYNNNSKIKNLNENIITDLNDIADNSSKVEEEILTQSEIKTNEDIYSPEELFKPYPKGTTIDMSRFEDQNDEVYIKELPKDKSSIKIVSSINEFVEGKKDNNNAEDSNSDLPSFLIDELKNKDDSFENDLPIYSSMEDSISDEANFNKLDEEEQKIIKSVIYPVKGKKELKRHDSSQRATQLPIMAKETYTLNNNAQPINRIKYNYPPLDLLDKVEQKSLEISEEIHEKSKILENILESFSINVKVVDTVIGPVITRYELEIEQGTQVKRIEQISKDITMGLASPTEVIIQAPIPGKNRVGIEVPNKIKEIVSIREVLSGRAFQRSSSKIVFALGKDVAGKDILCDIKKMPHLLVAGATGMGKSVCLNTILISLLFHASPEDVRIILIDPKRVEFSIYSGMPHLLVKDIICDDDKAIAALEWAIQEMERRYILFQETRTRDIDSYNAKIDLKINKKLPRILIIVDEVSDLLATNKKVIEEKIKRITQKARAAGIHLILATQRPSVDVITGVIKTNLPSRISFKLMNGVDSKTILDEVGAERLLGRGDLFFKPAYAPSKIRVQGCYVTTEEVEKVIDYISQNNLSEFDESISNTILNPSINSNNEYNNGNNSLDEKFVDALRLAIENSKISIALIQRRLNVGFNRAGKIIEQMQSFGYISEPRGTNPREVYITIEEFEEKYGEL